MKTKSMREEIDLDITEFNAEELRDILRGKMADLEMGRDNARERGLNRLADKLGRVLTLLELFVEENIKLEKGL